MGTGGKPGATFKATVVSVDGKVVVMEGETEDVAYLQPGVEYLFKATPAANGGEHSGGEDEGHS